MDISRIATLLDIGYWLQIFFVSGMTTLGLALNSPAVVIMVAANGNAAMSGTVFGRLLRRRRSLISTVGEAETKDVGQSEHKKDLPSKTNNG